VDTIAGQIPYYNWSDSVRVLLSSKTSFGNWVIFAPSAWSYSNKTLEKAKTKSGYVLRFSLARISKEGNSTESEVTYTDYTPLKL